MRLLFAATVMILVNLPGHDGAVAQDIAPPIYVVSYIEVAPHSMTEARQLILSYSADARKAPGAADIDAKDSRHDVSVSRDLSGYRCAGAVTRVEAVRCSSGSAAAPSRPPRRPPA